MQKQTVRQRARARARQARAKVVQEQAKRERRLAKFGEAVAVALAERDAVVSDCEQRAGRALRSLIQEEGLSTKEALVWCGGGTLTGREVYRLIRGVVAEGKAGRDEDLARARVERVLRLQSEEPNSQAAAAVSVGRDESVPG